MIERDRTGAEDFSRLANEPTQSPSDELAAAQEALYNFFLMLVRNRPADVVLAEFDHLFIQHIQPLHVDMLSCLDQILVANQEQDFRYTLKRSCYILINNWVIAGNWVAIQHLIRLFESPILHRPTLSTLLKRLREWLQNFIVSQDFQELQLYASQHESGQRSHWSRRYTSYLLTAQAFNPDNSLEQQQAAKHLATQLKEQFKFDLAMYTTLAQCTTATPQLLTNPTGLGDRVLQLIRIIVAKRGFFSYTNLAHIFLQQIQTLSYAEFKHSLQAYLVFSLQRSAVVDLIHQQVFERLDHLYVEHNDEPMQQALLLRTVNRVIEVMTTEDHKQPAALFTRLAASYPLTLALLILKLVLINPYSRAHLDACIAVLVQYYASGPEADCQQIIPFFEIFNITMATCTENVEYSVIKMTAPRCQSPAQNETPHYRIFSQQKHTGLPY